MKALWLPPPRHNLWRSAANGVASLRAQAPVLFLFAALGACAVLFGLVATTASPVLIALIVGLFGGALLLAVPKVTISIIVVLGLSSGALLSMAGPGFDKVSWAISMMSFLLLLPVLMALPRRMDTPWFCWLALLFVIESVCSALLERQSMGEFAMGFKRYFQMYGLFLALATLNISAADFQRWLKWLFAIALIQLPFAAYERIVLVPLRHNGAEAMDVVAGTMGASLVGGSPNSVMAIFLIIAFLCVLIRWRAGALPGWQFLMASLILLAPLTLGETKIVVVMIPLAGAVLLRRDFLKNPLAYLPLLLGLAGLTVVMAYVYVYAILNSNFADVINLSLRYNIGSQGYGAMYLNRTTVISFWWSLQGWHDPVGFLFGHGLGSGYGFGVNTGHIAARYPLHGIGLTTASTLLWDVGVLGLLLYLGIFAAAWHTANRLLKVVADPVRRGDLQVMQVAIALFAMFMLYSDSQVNLIAMELIVAFALGYLAFLHRLQQGTIAPAGAVPR